jgi:hypothetical protein
MMCAVLISTTRVLLFRSLQVASPACNIVFLVHAPTTGDECFVIVSDVCGGTDDLFFSPQLSVKSQGLC